MSLSLRYGLLFIGLLLAALLVMNYLFDQERTTALHDNAIAQLRLQTERASGEFQHQIERLSSDILFLAQTPPLQSIRRLLREPQHAAGPVRFTTWYAQLEQLFLAFAYARPAYFQIRLIGVEDGGLELIRIERNSQSLLKVKPEALQRKGQRYYVEQARSLRENQVQLSRIDLNREHGRISLPETVTLRAVTPVTDGDGRVFALVVINLNMAQVLERMRQYLPANGQMYLINQEGFFIYHPDARKAMTFDRADPYRFEDEFPTLHQPLMAAGGGSGAHFDFGTGKQARLAYALNLQLAASAEPVRRLTLVLSEPATTIRQPLTSARKRSFLAIALLMSGAILLVVFVANRLTATLRGLILASETITQGRYDIEMAPSACREFEPLTHSFEHMQLALRVREEQLKHLNQTLEQQVNERTQALAASQAKLAKEQLLLQSILDHVGDGVVAVDTNGRTVLWNRSTEKILGMGPTELPAAEWPGHFGIYRSPNGEPLSAAALPLVRALKGETIRNQELFIRNPGNAVGRWIAVFARPLRNDGATLEGAVAVLVDIDDSRRLREQRAVQTGELARIGRLTLLGQIVDTMAHRLSQPLAAIANYTGAAIQLRSSNALDEQRLDQILSKITRLAERGGEILLALRSLTLRGSRPRGKVDINALVLSALQLLGDRLQREQIRSEPNLAPELPGVYGQKMELQQVIIHLIINAMEALAATKNPDRLLSLITACSAGRERVRVEVSDNGPGIAPELYEQIFEPWFTTKPDALGLGLTVARSITENHGGSVSIRNQGNGTTRFVMELPAFDESHE